MALPWTNINAQYANGNTPLILAVQGKALKVIKFLKEIVVSSIFQKKQ
jgi:hypothetical protein